MKMKYIVGREGVRGLEVSGSTEERREVIVVNVIVVGVIVCSKQMINEPNPRNQDHRHHPKQSHRIDRAYLTTSVGVDFKFAFSMSDRAYGMAFCMK